MPSFNVSIPQIPKRFDLRDVTDPIDRKLEVAEQAASLLQSTLYWLKTDAELGTAITAGSYPRPTYIISGGGVTAYEAAVDAALAAAVTALAQLKAVSSLS